MITSKKIIGLAASVIIMLMFALPSNGQFSIPNEKIIFKVIADEEPMHLKLYLANLLDQRTSIKIYDDNRRQVHSSIVANTPGYASIFNLSALYEGDYTFVVSQKGIKLTKEFYLGADEVAIAPKTKIDLNERLLELQAKKKG